VLTRIGLDRPTRLGLGFLVALFGIVTWQVLSWKPADTKSPSVATTTMVVAVPTATPTASPSPTTAPKSSRYVPAKEIAVRRISEPTAGFSADFRLNPGDAGYSGGRTRPDGYVRTFGGRGASASHFRTYVARKRDRHGRLRFCRAWTTFDELGSACDLPSVPTVRYEVETGRAKYLTVDELGAVITPTKSAPYRIDGHPAKRYNYSHGYVVVVVRHGGRVYRISVEADKGSLTDGEAFFQSVSLTD
jgi:hypothetical protein